MSMNFKRKLPIPMDVKAEFPVTEKMAAAKAYRDSQIRDVFEGKSDKFILIIGPCSADHRDPVLEYISRLSKIEEQVSDKIIMIVYTLTGFLSGIAGLIYSSRISSCDSNNAGVNYEMDAMACVAIGGVSMNGGDGNLAKVVLGAIVLGVLLNALNLLGVQANPQLIVRGAVIILAVILDVWNKKAKLKEVAK